MSMLFVIRCLDIPGSQAIRRANRAQHLDYLRALGRRIKLAGPLLSDETSDKVGSLLVIEFQDRTQAERFAVNDPYARAGLFEEVSIRRFEQVLPPLRSTSTGPGDRPRRDDR